MASATAMANPTQLTFATRFRPAGPRTHSRSPSRSPVRTAQFRAQHLDPLLRNLSPESTLQALRATETIQQSSGQDVLTKSIADASPSEREVGIRAAFAAQKLREWRKEISQWQWPSPHERGLGAGFLPPTVHTEVEDDGSKRVYLGHLPLRLVDQHEQRLAEIRDDMESLEMDDIKDHVLAAHATTPEEGPAPASFPRLGSRASSYGRMRDFTALVTATVIQALPDLAILTALLDTWDVRLSILRELPTVLSYMEGARRGVRAATESLKDPSEASTLTQTDFQEAKALLGGQVSEYGERIDKLLDMLEGQEDALPQIWIDMLENVELEYATWCVDAQHVVASNEARERGNLDKGRNSPIPVTPYNAGTTDTPAEVPPHGDAHAKSVNEGTPSEESPSREPVSEEQLAQDRSKVPPVPLTLDLPTRQGHRREISEVSNAESTFSAMSGLSDAEIVEARQTQVLPSPKVSMVQNPFNTSKDALSFFNSKEDMPDRPPMVQRASTASFEVVPKEMLKRVDLRRSMSAELLTKMTQSASPPSTPSKALQQLNGRPSTGATPLAELENPMTRLEMPQRSAASTALPSPSLMVEPLKMPPKISNQDDVDSPISPISPMLPRRSSKRKSLPLSIAASQLTPITSIESEPPSVTRSSSGNLVTQKIASPRRSPAKEATLESKIQDILQTLPTKIRLTDTDRANDNQDSSDSTRASTPTPGLVLSPAQPSHTRSAGDTGVRLFHLQQHGSSRDSAPVKLFVRAVGEDGERVMVRVGGGWADLGEYLKEYSVHHRSKSIANGAMEVAQYPSKSAKEVPPAPADHSRRLSGSLAKATRRRSASQTSLETSKNVAGRSSRSPSPPLGDERSGWSAPPVPPIPASFTISSPRITVTTRANGQVETRIDPPPPTPLQPPRNGVGADQPDIVSSSVMSAPGVTTTTTTTTQGGPNSKYTPLGAAGPKPVRRVVTLNNLDSDKDSQEWVQGMVGKARAVSGSNGTRGSKDISSLATTSTPPSRRASAMLLTASPKPLSPASTFNKEPKEVDRRKSRLSLGDVGGIKRVFLRRKSEKQQPAETQKGRTIF
jgi:hypothetical protein